MKMQGIVVCSPKSLLEGTSQIINASYLKWNSDETLLAKVRVATAPPWTAVNTQVQEYWVFKERFVQEGCTIENN